MADTSLEQHYRDAAYALLLLLSRPTVDTNAVAALMASLDAETQAWISDELAAAYGDEIDGDFMALATTLHTDLALARQTVAQMAYGMAGKPQAERRQALAQRGISAFVSDAGNRWQLETYAAVAINSAVTHAKNTGTINRAKRAGGDLVLMVSAPDCCGICAPYAGRVYSISGDDPQFPPLDFAFPGDYASLHPNCRCYVQPIGDDEADEYREASSAPFDVDPRSEEQRRAYIEGQNAKRRERETIDQWRRYRATLGLEVPDLDMFRRLKAADGGPYRYLQGLYRDANRAVTTP